MVPNRPIMMSATFLKKHLRSQNYVSNLNLRKRDAKMTPILQPQNYKLGLLSSFYCNIEEKKLKVGCVGKKKIAWGNNNFLQYFYEGLRRKHAGRCRNFFNVVAFSPTVNGPASRDHAVHVCCCWLCIMPSSQALYCSHRAQLRENFLS